MRDKDYYRAVDALKFYQHMADNYIIMLRLKTKWVCQGEFSKLIRHWNTFI